MVGNWNPDQGKLMYKQVAFSLVYFQGHMCGEVMSAVPYTSGFILHVAVFLLLKNSLQSFRTQTNVLLIYKERKIFGTL
jgi:hypothetical protein